MSVANHDLIWHVELFDSRTLHKHLSVSVPSDKYCPEYNPKSASILLLADSSSWYGSESAENENHIGKETLLE